MSELSDSAAVGRGRRCVVVLSCLLIGSGAVTGCDPVRVLKTSALVGDVRVKCAGDAFARVTREDVIALTSQDPNLVVVTERGEEFSIATGGPDGRVEVMSRWIGERSPRDLERVERIQREMLRRLASICGRRDATSFECSTWWGITPAKKGPTCFLGEEPPTVPVGRGRARTAVQG